jgi:FKBP-type peptidyl-prolyl cis-trans isomerase
MTADNASVAPTFTTVVCFSDKDFFTETFCILQRRLFIEPGYARCYDKKCCPLLNYLLLSRVDDFVHATFGARWFRASKTGNRGPKDSLHAGPFTRQEHQALRADAGRTGDRSSGSQRFRDQCETAGRARGLWPEGRQEFAETVAKEKDATKTASGVVIRTIKAGSGPSPAPEDVVKVHYEGKLIDGTIFDSSVKRGEPAEFPLNGVVPCWTEAVQKMKKGEKAQIVCPSSAAYGDRGSPPTIPPGATLSFEVELLDFHKP